MKPDAMLVEGDFLVTARQAVATKGAPLGLKELGLAEPILAAFIHESLAAVAGKMALSGAPTEIVQGVHEDVLGIVLTCHQALRLGHYELWKDTMLENVTSETPGESQTKRKRPRKKVSDRERENENS
jgi:hypothetical protein